MKLTVCILLVLLALLQYRLWFGAGGFIDVQKLEQTKQELAAENEQLKERNASLAAEVVDLQHGLEAVEERARSEMGMIKSDEVFYQIIEPRDLSGRDLSVRELPDRDLSGRDLSTRDPSHRDLLTASSRERPVVAP
ncbi:MAG: cell division protein FtsB [Gammaproteobacteria bacterium]|nr:cell division protein FtsB [Gammaproteobacteria bacterium]MCY4209748.1 cell division protein FtsB [Gammaproteobacteria bacterium]MCY4283073.1 cell division protein FtsB [Gammaproteobacteria bacterium]MCY4337705.1 cell division protein FtsB [Gammaproteobacteria bacterium]